MKLNTASEVISFARKLEEDTARLYEDLAQRYTETAETLLSLAKENKKNIAQIERAYYGVITDALEGCFAFDLNLDEYVFATERSDRESYTEALVNAMAMEEEIQRFYADAAEKSKARIDS